MARNPRSIAEAGGALPAGADAERFAGYGVMGQPFASGHYLAFRHFAASSVGPGYASVWHRDPAGDWVIYSSVSPRESCARYYSSALAQARVAQIAVEWTGPFGLTVQVPGELEWDIELGRSPATVVMTGLGSVMPAALWRNPGVLASMSRVAGPALGVGRVRLWGGPPPPAGVGAHPPRVWGGGGAQGPEGGGGVGPPPRRDPP
ncbi:hypothetical protein, partial [Nocardia carnea]|uniref:hypothetical protein n=1 Tax=Nocardia carnea TaxID=37328 RepID=UPI002457A9B7